MRRSILLALPCLIGLLAGCGGSKPSQPPPKDPPQVFLTIPVGDVIGVDYSLTVNVNGCASVKSVVVMDHGNPVKTIQSPEVPVSVTLTKDDVSFAQGISATLSLSAEATCDDDRSNTSQPQPGSFFPVAKVFHSNSGQLVPDFYVVEGSGENVTFIGCDGSRRLARVNTSGEILASADLPFDCDYSSSITDLNATSGLRWFFTPGKGALAFDKDLKVPAVAVDGSGGLLKVRNLGVGPDGDAIVLGIANTEPNWIFRIAHDNCVGHNPCAPPLWANGQYLQAVPQGNPVINGTGAFAPMEMDDNAGNTTFFVEEYNYANGTDVSETILFTTQRDSLDPVPQIAMAISADGSRVLLPFDTVTAGAFQVDGCPINADHCSGGWVAPSGGSVFQGPVLAAAQFGVGGTYVAAIAKHNTYFLKMTSGENVGKGGLPITTSGSSVAVGYQGGKAQDFYLLSGPDGSAQAQELIGVDAPEKGELFRLQILSGSLTIGVADDGNGWMRVGNDLMELYPLSEYRRLRGG